MQIRTRLTYQFITIVAFMLFLSSLAIYFFSADYRKDNFHSRLANKASNTAKLLIEVEEVDADLLKKIEKDNPVSLPNEKIIIYNYQNEIIYSSDEKHILNIPVRLLDKIRLDGEIQFRQGDHEILGFLFADQYDRFVVVAAATDIYGLKKLQNLRMILLVVFGISIMLAFIAGWIFSGKALKPISKVVEQVDNITITSLNLRVDEGNGKDEIARLAHTFNKMLDRLETSFKMQKNFIANASHELRTPLTAITGQLEVVSMNERDNSEYKETIHSVLEDMKNLNHVSNKLLLLAQASSETAEADFQPLRIDDIAWQARTELIKRNKGYTINVAFKDDLDDDRKLTVKGNEQLLKTAILNLMDNGCKYSGNHQVNVHIDAGDKQVILEFKDNGIGIAEEDLKHIFEPFHRGRNAITIKGHGIGLSLVERIIKLHGGIITVSSVINQGTIFTISLPSSGF